MVLNSIEQFLITRRLCNLCTPREITKGLSLHPKLLMRPATIVIVAPAFLFQLNRSPEISKGALSVSRQQLNMRPY